MYTYDTVGILSGAHLLNEDTFQAEGILVFFKLACILIVFNVYHICEDVSQICRSFQKYHGVLACESDKPCPRPPPIYRVLNECFDLISKQDFGVVKKRQYL